MSFAYIEVIIHLQSLRLNMSITSRLKKHTLIKCLLFKVSEKIDFQGINLTFISHEYFGHSMRFNSQSSLSGHGDIPETSKSRSFRRGDVQRHPEKRPNWSKSCPLHQMDVSKNGPNDFERTSRGRLFVPGCSVHIGHHQRLENKWYNLIKHDGTQWLLSQNNGT